MAKELVNIFETGIYTFQMSSSSELYFQLEYVPSSKPAMISDSEESEAEVCTQKEMWTREQINDFVLKLGFLDTQGEGVSHIKHFLHINEVCLICEQAHQASLSNPNFL